MKAQSFFTRAKTLKVEIFESKHIADIMDSYE